MDWAAALQGWAWPARRPPGPPALPAQPKVLWQPIRMTKPPAQPAAPALERLPAEFAGRLQARQDAAQPQDAGAEEPGSARRVWVWAAESERLEEALGEPVQLWAPPGEEFPAGEPETWATRGPSQLPRFSPAPAEPPRVGRSPWLGREVVRPHGGPQTPHCRQRTWPELLLREPWQDRLGTHWRSWDR